MKKSIAIFGKRQSILKGSSSILLGTALMIFGDQVPRLGYLLFLLYLFSTAVWSLMRRSFQPRRNRENLLITFSKIFLSAYLLGSIQAQNLTVYLIVLIIAFYQIFTASICLITWLIYKNNQITPRLHYLFDAIWMGAFGFYSISPFHDAANFELLLLGCYLLTLGATDLRDGIFFNNVYENRALKRHLRVCLPIFLKHLSPSIL
ncbi:hypothetical protein STRDD10_00769 [Streptococcus sp. DD10]|nr:hypothetical protein [Streptococcus sp. DD10]KXT74683.1 hypothetical protein STRDD10_00769 [Streptococcus sp. DD10]